MGCTASIAGGLRSNTSLVGPDPRILQMMPQVTTANTTAAGDGQDAAGAGRRLTMKHTPNLDNEPAQRLQSFVLEMSKKGKVELTSVVSRDGSTQEMGTLTKQQLPSLQQIPGVVFGMAKLLELNLRCNQISAIPKEIAMLKALEVLVVSENQLGELPREIVELKRLKTLDVADNHIKRLPDDIGGLTKLETLRANRNRLVALPNSIKKCTRLKVINLYNNIIMTLGDGISELCELEELNVSNNLLVFFPEVKRWKNLRRLYLQVNKLVTLPSMDALCNLELLTVQQNGLKAFPSMDNLVHLKKIDANTNQIASIPPCFERMSSLMHLSLRKNLLTLIPAFLCRCKCLEILDFGDNPLLGPLPVSLVTLPQLKTFLIDGTFVTVVPIELMALRHVTRVNLGSCLQMDDQETCEVVMELRSSCAQNGGWLKTG
ncbi:Lap4 protein [Globisporangium polare]